MLVERSVEVAAAPERVFAAIADPAAHLRWRPSLVAFDGDVRPGGRLVEVVRWLGRRYRTVYEVTELDPPRALALRSLEGPVPLELRCRVEPGRVTIALDVRAPRLVAWILGRELGKELANLKRLVDQPVEG